jgi:hypothetical protein
MLSICREWFTENYTDQLHLKHEQGGQILRGQMMDVCCPHPERKKKACLLTSSLQMLIKWQSFISSPVQVVLL